MASDGSATLVANWYWDQDGFPQAATAIVIVGICQQPKKQTCHQQKGNQCDGLCHKGVSPFGTLVSSSRLRLWRWSLGTFINAGLKLLPQGVVIDVASDQHQLILAFTSPVGVVDREALACEVEDVTSFAFVEPGNPFALKTSAGS